MIVAEDMISHTCLIQRAQECIKLGIYMLIEVPYPWKRPKGFPRGRLACINSAGNQARYVNPKKVLAFCKALEAC